MADGRLKKWFKKPRLSDEEWRVKTEFVIKIITIIAGGWWLVFAGTDLIDKRSKRLGIESVPVADTSLNYVSKIDEGDPRHCLFSGKFAALNSGDLAFEIDYVTFELYRMQDLPNWDNAEVVSYALSERLAGLKPIKTIEIPVNETFSKRNVMERSFGFRILMGRASNGKAYSYTLVANGSGGLAGSKNSFTHWLAEKGFMSFGLDRFGENDLRHDTGLRGICDGKNIDMSTK